MSTVSIRSSFKFGPPESGLPETRIFSASLEAPLREPGDALSTFPRVGDEIGATLRHEHGTTPRGHPAPHRHHPAHVTTPDIRHGGPQGHHRPQAHHDPYTTLGPDDYRLTDSASAGGSAFQPHHGKRGIIPSRAFYDEARKNRGLSGRGCSTNRQCGVRIWIGALGSSGT